MARGKEAQMKLMTVAMVMAGVSSMVCVRSVEAGCRITVKAQYRQEVRDPVTGKRIEKITLDLVESDVKDKLGTWKKMQSMCNPNQLTISLGSAISTSCELDTACGKRQFRFESYYTDANGDKQDGAITYVPARNEWKDLDTSTTVDVGELGSKF
jgi:hypothetical protein